MKKLFLLGVLFLFVSSLFAEEFEVDGINYDITSDTVPYTVKVTSKYAKYEGDIIIPEQVQYNSQMYAVTSIGDFAFSNSYNLTSIEIPNSVTSIGERSFYNCNGLTSIVIPNSVTSIEYGAFIKCTSLTSIEIPYSVTSIGSLTFDGCSGLTSVEIPNSVASIGIQVFGDCSSLTSIVIPNSVTSISDFTFVRCSNLTSIIIPNSITSIGILAFGGCTSLTSIEIPNTVTSIGSNAFNACSGLTSIEIPNSVTNIDISDYNSVFSFCSSLTSIEIPNCVTSIGRGAFSGCSSLTSIVIPYSVTNIVSNAFLECNRLSSIEVSADNEYYASLDGVLYNKDITAILKYPRGISGYFEIPNTVTSIGDQAFMYCDGLTSIAIPNSVTSIGLGVFSDCRSLTSIELPNSVTNIGGNAFYSCSSLTSVTIPNAVKSIDGFTFYNCTGLTSIVIPNSVTSIGSYAFNGCTSLSSIKIPNSVTSIERNAFWKCSSLTLLEIPSSVTSIGQYAFAYCTGLTSIICHSAFPADIDWGIFYGVPEKIPVYVPYASVSFYKHQYGWEDLNILPLPPIVGSGENLVSGRVYLDINTNASKDSTERGLAQQKILILPDSVYAQTDKAGNYIFRCNAEDHQIQLVLPENWRATTTVRYDVSLRTEDSSKFDCTAVQRTADTSGFDFGMAATREESRSEVSIASLDGGRCFEPAPVYLTYNNNGTSIENGMLKFYPDSLFEGIIKSVPAYDSLSADSSIVYWKMSEVMPFEQRIIILQMQMPDFTAMGDTLVSALAFEDKASVQYTDTAQLVVRCSYDPNDKQVNPAGVQDEHFVLMSDPLEFTIRFQNTGNDVANRVVIFDTLSQHLDLATFAVIASSHSVKTNRNNEGVVEFRFDNIMLADSTTNEPASHGFVKYRIKAKTGLPDSTVVENTSHIFFDYNPAVVTNTTAITMTYKIPQKEVQNTEDPNTENPTTNVSQSTKSGNAAASIHPNPFIKTALLEFDNPNKDVFELQIADVLGKPQQAIKSTGKLIVIERGDMPEGLYFFTLHNTASGLVYNGNFVVE